MIISTNISEARADYLDAAKLDPTRDRKALRILYYLAGEADRIDKDLAGSDGAAAVLLTAYSEIAAELFDDAVTAARRGELD